MQQTLILTLLLGGLVAAQDTAQAQNSAATPPQVEEVLQDLKQYYLRPFDEAAVRRGAATGVPGMLQALGDDSVWYLPPLSSNTAEHAKAGGATFGLSFTDPAPGEKNVRVGEVITFTSAWEKGLRSGDVLVTLGQQPAGGRSAQALTDLLEQAGQTVELTVQRQDAVQQVTLERKPTPSIQVERAQLPAGTAYLAVPTLYTLQADALLGQVSAALDQFRKDSVKHLILDLRNNPGGELSTAVNLADFFMTSGTIVGFEFRDGKKVVYGKALSSRTDFRGSLVVLVNRLTIGSSEVVASALQHSGALIVGERTAGMTVAILPLALQGGGSIGIPYATLFTQAGNLQGQGVAPNLEVRDDRRPPSEGEVINLAGDPVLNRALQELGKKQ